MVRGGQVMALFHASENVVIAGTSLGTVLVSAPLPGIGIVAACHPQRSTVGRQSAHQHHGAVERALES